MFLDGKFRVFELKKKAFVSQGKKKYIKTITLPPRWVPNYIFNCMFRSLKHSLSIVNDFQVNFINKIEWLITENDLYSYKIKKLYNLSNSRIYLALCIQLLI